MKVIYTKHALKDKLPVLKRFGWYISKEKIEETVTNPKWKGVSKHGQGAMSLVDEKHILRVVIRREGDIITVITLHIARRGKYESTL